MPRRDARALLHDVAQACEAAMRIAAQTSLDAYRTDRLLRSASERELMIIGEAMNHALRIDPTIEGKITDARRIVDFRNVVVHAYHSLDADVVWAILQDDVPKLLDELRPLLP